MIANAFEEESLKDYNSQMIGAERRGRQAGEEYGRKFNAKKFKLALYEDSCILVYKVKALLHESKNQDL